MTYQPHKPPQTFKFPETVYGKQKKFPTLGIFFAKKVKEGV